jgi:hypothetical protein
MAAAKIKTVIDCRPLSRDIEALTKTPNPPHVPLPQDAPP